MADGSVLEIPEQVGLAPPTARRAQAETQAWPEGTILVSADSHMLETDCWIDSFPEHLKDKAPRMLFRDGGWHLGPGGVTKTPPEVYQILCDVLECYPGLSNVDVRLADCDVEGVAKELIFPHRLFGLMMFGDVEHREEVYAGYNAHVAAQCAKAPDRLYAVMVPNYWDPPKAAESVAQCKAMGARCLLVPSKAGKFADGQPLFYNDPKMDPFWAAVSESGLPLAFHIGEAIPGAMAGMTGIRVLTEMQGFRNHWGQLVYGGVFDRFPKLKAIFVEAGIAWVASMLHDADLIYSSFERLMEPKLKHPPSWYWANHCYATFMTDPVGLETLDRIGVDTVLWSTDYPHQESTFGYTRSAVEAVFKATSVENAQKILGKTALKLFRMD